MRTTTAAAAAAILLGTMGASSAQSTISTFNDMQPVPGRIIPGVGQVITPYSSIEQAGDRGKRMHTHYHILATLQSPAVPSSDLDDAQMVSPNADFNTPASVACIYGMVPKTHGCDSRKVKDNPTGGVGAVAIVDAFHNPHARADLNKFSKAFNLPEANFKVIYCSSSKCGVSTPPPFCQDANQCGWAGEIILDVEWAHAMAPDAKIILVEANSNSGADLLLAEDAAAAALGQQGGQVSNSWGGGEFSGQASLDTHFTKSKVLFFASTGDHKCGSNCADVEWPSTSAHVIGVGGTTIVRRANGSFQSQTPWIGGGGGLSAQVGRPSFQDAVQARVGSHRGAPDISWLADPETGAIVYCSTPVCGGSSGFFVFGGTSLAAPAIAAMVNNQHKRRSSSAAQNTFMYNGLGGAHYTDIKTGQCKNGPGGSTANAVTGWDVCNGLGTPKGLSGL